ncbi:MAG: hypothetical protein E7012_05835 [Alphaproteobacteria bacterium]|nr:hypothetical protein [Alphaproteobacteria bacterium]
MEKEIIFEPNLGDIFGLDKYPIYREFANQHDYKIIELDPIVEHTSTGENIKRRYSLITRPKLSYIELRRQNYPSIPDQLDMIYWDRVNNTQVWQETISQIKNKYPKPASGEES